MEEEKEHIGLSSYLSLLKKWDTESQLYATKHRAANAYYEKMNQYFILPTAISSIASISSIISMANDAVFPIYLTYSFLIVVIITNILSSIHHLFNFEKKAEQSRLQQNMFIAFGIKIQTEIMSKSTKNIKLLRDEFSHLIQTQTECPAFLEEEYSNKITTSKNSNSNKHLDMLRNYVTSRMTSIFGELQSPADKQSIEFASYLSNQL